MTQPKYSLTWKVLPNNIDNGIARFSVIMSPRFLGKIGGVTTLDTFGDGLLDWPHQVSNLPFRILVQSTQSSGAVLEDVELKPTQIWRDNLETNLWKRLFGPETLVMPELPDQSSIAAQEVVEPIIASYPRAILTDLVKRRYAREWYATRQGMKNGARIAKKDLWAAADLKPFEYIPPGVSAKDLIKDMSAQADQPLAPVTAYQDQIAEALSFQKAMKQLQLFHRVDTASPHYEEVLPLSTTRMVPANELNAQVVPDEVGNTYILPAPAVAIAGKSWSVIRLISSGKEPSPNDLPEAKVKINGGAPIRLVSGEMKSEVYVHKTQCWTFSCDGDQWFGYNANQIDFDKAWAGLGQYPDILRKLGVIFDFEIDATKLGLAGGNNLSGLIRAIPSGDRWNDGCCLSPWTAFEIGKGQTESGLKTFLPKANSSRQAQEPYEMGFLDLQSFDVSLGDIDGTAFKLAAQQDANENRRKREEIQEIGQTKSPRPEIHAMGDPSNDEEILPPSIRSAGFVVSNTQSAQAFESAIQKQKRWTATHLNQIEKLSKPGVRTEDIEMDVLDAHDLVAGYCIDVWSNDRDKGSAWRSLCRRQVSLHVGDGPSEKIITFTDEGCVSDSTPDMTDDEGNVIAQVSEIIFSWDGWSLQASRPAKDPDEETENVSMLGVITPGFKIEEKAQKGSLPKLRLDRHFSFRARLFDIAGNRLSIEQADQVMAQARINKPHPDEGENKGIKIRTLTMPFKRFEPVAPPIITPLQKEIETRTEDDNEGDVSSDKETRQGENLTIHEQGGRTRKGKWLIAPPKISKEDAWTYGMLDGFVSGKASWQALKGCDGDLPQGYQKRLLTKLYHHPSGKLSLPYFPDPHAAGAAFRFLPGYESNHVKKNVSALTKSGDLKPIPFHTHLHGLSDGKPYAQPFILELKSGKTRKSEWDAQWGVLRVTLPPGEQQLVKLSCALAADDRTIKPDTLFGLADWAASYKKPYVNDVMNNTINTINTSPSANDAATYELDGLNWLLTPSKTLTLVNATQKPVHAPGYSPKARVLPRPPDARQAVLKDEDFSIHAPSTSEVWLSAEWTDPLDDPELPDFLQRPGSMKSEKITIEQDDLTQAPLAGRTPLPLEETLTFEDTKHREVTFGADAVSRYREYFDSKAEDEADFVRTTEKTVTLSVPSTVPPTMTEVVYVVPTFYWSEEQDLKSPFTFKGTIERTRESGLRVYMKRSWYSSGAGEKLGVILRPSSGETGKIPDEHFTSWGGDPTIDFPGPPRHPVLADFTKCTGKDVNCAIDVSVPVSEEKNQSPKRDFGLFADNTPKNIAKVDIATYDVKVDPDKNLLYADIKIDPQDISLYFPFIRLALARYQEQAIDYCHVSKIDSVLMVQIAPDRTLTLMFQEHPRDPTYHANLYMHVTVTGPRHDGIGKNRLKNIIEVRVERMRDYVLDDIAWESDSRKPVVLELSEDNGPNGISKWSAEIPVTEFYGYPKHRLVISEFEQYMIDGPREDGKPGMNNPTVRRVLRYSDVVEFDQLGIHLERSETGPR